MNAIVGIDVALASTGLARITTNHRQWVAETCCRISKPTGRTLLDRHQRLRDITHDVVAFTDPAALVVIETPSLGVGRQAGTHERSWLWGAIVDALLRRGLPLVEVAPAIRSKFTADKGGADKGAVALAVGRMWPDWQPGSSANVNDQADALALASIGVVLADEHPPFPMPAYRTKALTKVQLPPERDP